MKREWRIRAIIKGNEGSNMKTIHHIQEMKQRKQRKRTDRKGMEDYS